jgi:hypothetical protein
VRILLPPDAVLTTVCVTLTNSSVRELSEKWEVKPSPVALRGREVVWPKGARILNGRDLNAYERDEFQPPSFIERVLKGQMREWKFVDVEVAPYRYNPVSKKVTQLVDGQLLVTFERIPGFKALRSRSPQSAAAFRDIVRGSVVNFKDIGHEYDAHSTE